VAQVYRLVRRQGPAFEWLDRALRQNDGGLISQVDPMLRDLHGDPRYAAIPGDNLPVD